MPFLLRSLPFLVAFSLAAAPSTPGPIQRPSGGDRVKEPYEDTRLQFGDTGYTDFGEWQCSAAVSPAEWLPGSLLAVESTLTVMDSHLEALAAAGKKAAAFCLLVTAERTFDANGRLRLAGDERMSTLLTPTGLAIEGGVQGAVTDRFGYGFRTPVDLFAVRPLDESQASNGNRRIDFQLLARLPEDIPPGLYRLRLDFGIMAGRSYLSLNGDIFAKRPFFKGRPTESHLYSPIIRCSGRRPSGEWVDAGLIRPRIPWVLLANYNSNGYKGVVAEEDRCCFALSPRNIIPDEVILPLFDDAGRRLTYSLEPQFPADTIELRSAIPWDYARGELSVEITEPDGTLTSLGTSPFVGKAGQWPTTRNPAVTQWKPRMYGQHTVRATGWTADVWGNRYEGGGTYRFWIAKRMTLATATFQGMAYPVGARYGRDIQFAPAVPAAVEVNAVLYPNSDPARAKRISYKGMASAAGVFGAAQGAQPFVLDAPGEYHGHVLARYTDSEGHLWVCSMRHAGVVYSDDDLIVARGKKLTVKGQYLDRGETRFEGYVDSEGESHLAHVNFPYRSGDVLLIASDQQGANKIEPVLTYDWKDRPLTYDARWQAIGATNLRLVTSNGLSPHLFPEYITEWGYYYAAAPRPGFMGRFLVGEDGVRAPYWPTSPNSFGSQIGASSNGDLPGDIYRLLGGIVLRRSDGTSAHYAGYLSSAFLLPRGSMNNRVTAAGAEDVPGPHGARARVFLVGTRPGMIYETGSAWAPAAQIDPILPVTVTAVLTYPDGRQKVWQGVGDRFGSFVGADKAVLDMPGVYRFWLEADWEGHKGYMPGLPREGGDIYVVERDRPADARNLLLDLPNQTTFPSALGITIAGSSTARSVRYAAVIPGAVVEQGSLQVHDGRFEYFFDPGKFNSITPTYDNVNLVTGRPEIGDVVHLTFFSGETMPDGRTYHSFARVIIRGNKIFYAR